VEHKEIALRAFLDTEGAFDKKSLEILIKATEQHQNRCTICCWVGPMLESRIIMATLAEESLKGFVSGCFGGGIGV